MLRPAWKFPSKNCRRLSLKERIPRRALRARLCIPLTGMGFTSAAARFSRKKVPRTEERKSFTTRFGSWTSRKTRGSFAAKNFPFPPVTAFRSGGCGSAAKMPAASLIRSGIFPARRKKKSARGKKCPWHSTTRRARRCLSAAATRTAFPRTRLLSIGLILFREKSANGKRFRISREHRVFSPLPGF